MGRTVQIDTLTSVNRGYTIVLAGILLFAAGFRLATLNRPFDRDPEGCGAFYGLLSRNYFRYDVSQHFGLPIMSMGQGAKPAFYANHPPTTPWLIAIVHLLTGYRGSYETLPGEWQTRLPTAIFLVGSIGLIAHLVRRRATARAAVLAAGLFASIPMTLYYGGLPDVISPQLVFFALLTIAAYEGFLAHPNGKRFALLVLAFGGAAVMDWPAFFLVPVMGLHFVCTKKPREWTWIFGFGVITVIMFLTLYAYLALGQSSWNWMAAQVQRRALSGATDAAHSFTFAKWVEHAIWEICIARHTLIVVLLAMIWTILAIRRRFRGTADRFTGLLLGWGVLHVLMGRQGVYQHEWWWWPMTPGLVIAAALLIDQLIQFLETRKRLPIAAGNAVIAVLLVAFAGWNTQRTLAEFAVPGRIDKGGIEYTLGEIGDVIRASVSPGEAAMVAESDVSLGFWYYADRAMKRQIWDIGTLERRLNDGAVDLSFEAAAPWSGPVKAMIVPKSYSAELTQFISELRARYTLRETEKFLVFDLTLPRPSE